MITPKQEKIIEINKRLLKQFGIPRRENPLPDPLNLLIATILSQNTNDKNSFRAFKELKEKYPDWDKALEASREVIAETIKIAGLAKQKSNAIKILLNYLYDKYGNLSLDPIIKKGDKEILDELTIIPGIGVKTASCVLLFALDRNVCPVDTHVHRTLNRIGVVKGSAPDKTFSAINDGLPENIAHPFHTNLIRLGREICTPSKPTCGICPLEELCEYSEKDFTSFEKKKENNFFLLDNINTPKKT